MLRERPRSHWDEIALVLRRLVNGGRELADTRKQVKHFVNHFLKITIFSKFTFPLKYCSAAFPLTVLLARVPSGPTPAHSFATTAVSMPASLLYEATQALTKEELSALGSNGLLELCALDRRFHPCAGHPALRARARVMRSAPPPASPALRVQV